MAYACGVETLTPPWLVCFEVDWKKINFCARTVWKKTAWKKTLR